MKFYLDTEFHEYHKQHKVLGFNIGNPIPTVDLISIGIVNEIKPPTNVYSETVGISAEYYAICKDFNIKDAWDSYQIERSDFEKANGFKGMKHYWLRDNVLKPIFIELTERERKEFKGGSFNDYFGIKNFTRLINKYGKSKDQITKEIKSFVAYADDNDLSPQDFHHPDFEFNDPKFYAYYADRVVFAQLFGKMNDLPNGFPMYCINLKQELDGMCMYQESKYKGVNRLDAWLQDIEKMDGYPSQEDEHNALGDAKWNRNLHSFLNKL